MAHGLMLRMKDMLENKNERPPDVKNPHYPTSKATNSFVDEVSIIQSWLNATRYPENSRIEYLTLLRQTLMFIFSRNWDNSSKKEDLLHAYKTYCMKFSSITPNCVKVYNAVMKIAEKPWKNPYFAWETLFNETTVVEDVTVACYFAAEPEEILLARVHSLVIQGHVHAGLVLSKMSFMYRCRVKGQLSGHERTGSSAGGNAVGHASIDWYAFLMLKTKTLSEIISEVQKWKCHEGIEILYRLQRDPKNIKFCCTIITVLLIEHLIRSKDNCCTKKLFVLYCKIHKEMNSSLTEFAESARKIFANYSPSSSHLYLFVDVVWSQYGIKCLDLYIELYVRGLTADLNHLEASESSSIPYLETHLATMFEKLSTLFSGFLDIAARECMFSAFSLRPSKERLYILQSLTQNLLSGDNNKMEKSTASSSYEIVRYCDCRLKCTGPCRMKMKNFALNPLLNLGVKSVSYHLIKDLVCVLENARSIKFQYNMFDWQSNITELGDYLKASNQSETELNADSSGVGSSQEISDFVSENTSTSLTRPSEAKCSVKRKSVSDPCALDVAANVEVESNESLKKRSKVPGGNTDNQNSRASQQYPYQPATANAIESQQTHRNSVFSEVKRESPVSHTVYPYSLTDRGKQENFSTPQRMSSKSSMNRLKSSVESQNNFIATYTNTNQPVVSPPSVSYSRQSVVISSVNNAVANKFMLPDPEVKSAMPYSVESPTDSQMYSQVRGSTYQNQNIKDSSIVEDALNLSCSSEFQRSGGTGNFSSQSSTATSSQSTNSPNSTHFMLISSKRQECHDRNSVIHHTMQHIRENSIPISREIVVSLDAKTPKRFKHNSDSSSCHNVANKPEHPTFESPVRHSFSHNNLTSSHCNPTNLAKPEIFATQSNFTAVKNNNKKLEVAEITNTNNASSSRKMYKPYAHSVSSVSKPQTDLQGNTINTTYDSMYDSQPMKHQTLTYQDSSWQRPSTQNNYQNNYVISSSSQNYHLSNTNTSSNYQQHGITSLSPSVNQPARPNHSLLRATPLQKNVIQVQQPPSENVRKSMTHPLHLASHKQQPTYIHGSNSALNNTSTPNVSPNTVPSIATSNPRVYSRNSMPILKSRLSPCLTTTSVSANSTCIHPSTPSLNSAEDYGTSQRQFSSLYTQQSSTLPHSQASATGINSYSATSRTQSFSRPANQAESLEQPYTLPHSQALTPGINYGATSASQSFSRHSNQAESTYNHDMYNNPIRSTDERGVFRAGNTDSSLNYSPSSVGSSQKVCCSPHEVKPCQSCSPSEKGREQQYDFPTARNPYPETGIPIEVSVECPVAAEESGDPEILCHFCAFAFSASLMDQHLKEYHQKELTTRKNRQIKKKCKKGDIYLTDSNTLSTKSEKHREDFDERIDIETSKLPRPMQMGKNTLLHNSSLQSLPDNNSFDNEEIIFCSLCNIKLLSGAEFESHMTSCHSKLDNKEIYQSAGSNDVCAQPTQNFAFSSLMSEDLGAEVYSSLESNNQQSKDDVSQTTNKSLKVKKQLKCPTIPCKYCGKILTDKYMKTHFQKMHKDICKTLYSGCHQENSSLEIKSPNSDFQSVSTLLQEDIACLSPSDALNLGDRFGIVAPEHVSPCDSSIKTENMKVNRLSKSKSKFKSINKSLQLTLKANASLKSNESKVTMESAHSKNYRCHICFRMYTTKLFLTRHLLNFHKISTNTSSESSTVGQEPSLINQMNSKFSDIEQNGKSLVQNNYELSANEISGLHASNNKQFSNGSRDVDQVETTRFEQVSFNNSVGAHSINELSESNMTNPNLNPDGDPTKVAKVKKPRPKNFKCSMCLKAFSYSKLLEKHKAKLHPNSLFVEHNNNEPQNCESTFQISNQQTDKAGISQNMDQLLVEQTLQHHESASHKNEPYFNLPITTENTLNNNYSSSNPSDKVSLSKSDSFFHSSVCSSDDFIYEKNFCDNTEQKDSGSYSKQNSIETFKANPSSSSMHFPSSYSTYSKNVEQGSDMNNAQMNFNENDNVACKSMLFTEMLRDSVDTSLPYQTSSCNSTMVSLPHAVYQQSTINLEASSVSTESNECPVCFKKMSTQDQLRHHIEKLHPSSALETTVQDDKQIDSKFNTMFTELQQAYSVINSTESCENEPLEVGENNFELSYQKKDTQELSFMPGMTSSPLKREEKQEQILTAFCNNFGNSTGPSSLKSLQQNEQDESERNYTSPTIPKIEPLEVQTNIESAMREVSSSAPLAGQDTNNFDPVVLTDNSSALKHAWMFSDLLEEFEAQTGPTNEQNIVKNEKCEALSLKNDVNIQVNFQPTTITSSSIMENYLTTKPEMLPEHDTLKESSELDAEINDNFNLASGDAFLSKGSHSVSMNDIFSDKFLGSHSDFTPHQIISASEQGEANDHLFSSDIKYASCEFDNQNNCEVDSEKMGQLFESEEIAKQISFLLNSGNESPNHDLMNITAAVSPGKNNFPSNAEESSFLNHTADQGIILTDSENPPTEFSITKPLTAAPKKPNFHPKKKHKCELCSKEFGGAWHLTRHMKSVHSAIPKFSEATVQDNSKINKAILDIKKDPGILSHPASNELVTLQPNSNGNVICKATVNTSNLVPVISISDKTVTCKLIPEPSMNSDLNLPINNILPKRKSARRNPCTCPVCPRMLCSSDSLRRHIRNLHPGCPLPASSKVLRPSTSIPAPVMQNSTKSGTSLIEKQKLNTFNNSVRQPIDKASLNPSVTFQTFPMSSTNLFGDDIEITKKISLNERKDSIKKASIGTVCKNFKTSTVSDYVEKTISTIANEIRLESLNKCARSIVKDQRSVGINSKSINETVNANMFPLPSIDNKHRLQLSAHNNNNLRTLQSNSKIVVIKCPSVVHFTEKPSEPVKTLGDFTNNKVKSEPLDILPDNENQTKIGPKFMSSEKNVKNVSVNSIKTNFSSNVQVIGLGPTGQSLSLKKKPNHSKTSSLKINNNMRSNSSPLGIKVKGVADTSVSSTITVGVPSKKNIARKKFPALKVPAKVKRFPNSEVKISSEFSKNSEKCYFCHKVFRSFAALSYHLKVIHKSKFTAASDTKCADKSSPNSSFQSSVFCSNSQAQASDTKYLNESVSESSPTPEIGDDQKADIELAKIKIELGNEVVTKSQFHEDTDSIAKRRSRRNDECEIVFEKPGTSGFLSTKCLPKKLNCISRKKYRNFKYPKLIKPKIELSSKQKGPEVINIASPVKNSSIPKCVIKVSNDGKYKIDKSPNYIKTGKAKFQFSKRRFCNGAVKLKQRCAHLHRRKLFTGLRTNIRGRRPLKSINLSSIANSKIKKNRMSIKNAAKQCSKMAKGSVPGQIKSYKKNSRNLNSSTETFRDLREIKRFLLEHKQPIVVLERLPNKFLNNPPYLVENLPENFFDFKAKPIVRIKRLNSFSLPNSLSLIKNCYVVVEKLQNSESVSLL